MELYKDLASDFANSRKYFESGWRQISEQIQTNEYSQSLSVLDLGCGSGRFWHYLQSAHPEVRVEYTGIDASNELLKYARQHYDKTGKQRWLQADILDLITRPPEQKYDLIVLLAVMHHIPHQENRDRLIDWLARSLNLNGMLVISFWQFGEYSRYRRKIGNDPQLVGMEVSEMERRDYIMSWNRGGTAYRFCHWCNKQEIVGFNRRLAALDVNEVVNYRADGRDNNQNWYWIWNQD